MEARKKCDSQKMRIVGYGARAAQKATNDRPTATYAQVRTVLNDQIGAGTHVPTSGPSDWMPRCDVMFLLLARILTFDVNHRTVIRSACRLARIC